jgi:acyl carrier protein
MMGATIPRLCFLLPPHSSNAEEKMDRSAILSKLNELIRDVFGEDDVVATDETTADDVAGWDSSNHVRLIIAIEEAFKVTFTTDEMLAPENVGELVDLIASKLPI